MKSIYKFTCMMVAILLVGFFPFQAANAAGESTKVVALKSFDHIETDGVFNLYLIQGESESLKIVAPQDQIELVTIQNDNNKVLLSTKKNFFKKIKSRISIYLTYKSIHRLTIQGVGNVQTEGVMKFNQLTVDGSSVGNITLNLSGAQLHTDLSSVGNVTLKGRATRVEIDHSGTGNLNAFELKAVTLSLDCSGVGNVNVYAEKEISIDCSGVGNVNYKGPAAVKQLSKSGVGSVKHLDN